MCLRFSDETYLFLCYIDCLTLDWTVSELISMQVSQFFIFFKLVTGFVGTGPNWTSPAPVATGKSSESTHPSTRRSFAITLLTFRVLCFKAVCQRNFENENTRQLKKIRLIKLQINCVNRFIHTGGRF